MKKILFLSYYFWPPFFGGELLIAIERLKEMAVRGHTVIVFTVGASGYKSRETMDGLRIYRSPYLGPGKYRKYLGIVLFWFWSIGKLILEPQIDVVHIEIIKGIDRYSEVYYGELFAMLSHWKKARNLIVHSLASKEDDFFFVNSLNKYFLDKIDTIVSVSEGLDEAVKKIYPLKARKIVYGIHEDIFVPMDDQQRNSFRQEHSVSDDEIVFTFLGSIEKRKGFDLIAEIISENHDRHPNWRLWVAGPTTKKESQYIHEDEVAELTRPLAGLDPIVKYWGRVDERQELARILGASDIFLFPSRREGFGIAPLEAMSAGVPVIISRIPGVTDHGAIDGITGIYITPGDKEQLENAILKLADDKALRKEMGNRGRERILEAFTWQEHVNRWEKLYRGEI